MIAAMLSGGKDSCLAVWRALNFGYKIDALICMLNEKGSSRAHGLNEKALISQANAVGIKTVFGKSTWQGYAEMLRRIIVENGFRKIVFGDIFLEEHRSWIEEFCTKIGVEPIFPIWGEETENLAKEFVDKGFEAYVIAVRKDIDRNILGKKFDRELIDYLISKGIDPCGENGEFHTYVVDGPLFSQRVSVKFGDCFESEKYFHLEIKPG